MSPSPRLVVASGLRRRPALRPSRSGSRGSGAPVALLLHSSLRTFTLRTLRNGAVSAVWHRRGIDVAAAWHRRVSGVASTCQRRVSGVSAACQLVSATCQRDSVVWPHRRNTLFSLGALLYSASPLFSLAIASSGGPLSPPRRRALSSIIASQPVARIRPESPSSAACCRTRVPALSNPGRFGSRLSPRAAFARCTLAAPRPSVQP